MLSRFLLGKQVHKLFMWTKIWSVAKLLIMVQWQKNNVVICVQIYLNQTTSILYFYTINLWQRRRITSQNRWNMEIKSLKLWNYMCFIVLSVFCYFSKQCVCTERKLKSKEQQLKGFISIAERKVEIELCCWETTPLSVFPFWCIGLPYSWTVGFFRWLCCPLFIVFCVYSSIGVHACNRQKTVPPWMHSSLGFNSNSVPRVHNSENKCQGTINQ